VREDIRTTYRFADQEVDAAGIVGKVRSKNFLGNSCAVVGEKGGESIDESGGIGVSQTSRDN